MSVSRETAAWAMRMLLGAEPPSNPVLDALRQDQNTLEELRESLLLRPDVQAALRRQEPSLPAPYAIPPFLLRPPASTLVPWRFEAPSLAQPVSQLCTAAQMREPDYAALAPSLGIQPGQLHRKFWEYAFIVSALRAKGMLQPERRGLGFGTGQEPLPAIFAAAGAGIVATDMPEDGAQAALWSGSAQWADSAEKLWRPGLLSRDDFLARVSFQSADMNLIDPALRGFDFNWSSSCMDHLGSIRNGLDFLHACLDTLRPGGVAVHTTEFNIDSNGSTLETPALSIFRKRDFEVVFAELIGAGHMVEPLNTWPGADPEDELVDRPPYGLPHLKLEVGGHRTTSIGMIITKQA